MKTIFLLFITLFSLSIGNIAIGQSNEVSSIYITCSGDPDLPYVASPPKIQSPMSDYSDIELRGYCITDIMDAIKSNLRHVGMALVVGTPPASRPTVATIYFGLDIHGTPTAQLENLTPEEFSIAPVIYPHPTDAIYLWATTTQVRQDSATLFSAILLYSVGRFDLALPYFEAARKSAVKYGHYPVENDQMNPPILDIIDFYEANCAAYSGNFKKAEALYMNSGLPSGIFYTPSTPVNLAWVELQQGESQGAFQLISKQIKIAQNSSYSGDKSLQMLLTKRSQFYAQISQFDLALADLNAAIQLDATYADAYYFRGLLYTDFPHGNDTRRIEIDNFQHYLNLAPNGQHADDAKRYIATLQYEIDTNPS